MPTSSRRRSRRPATILAIVAALSDIANAALPRIDFSQMGTVGIAGAFAGLDLVDSSRNITFDPSTSTLLSRASDGSLTPIAQTNPSGVISTSCTLDGKLYVAGLFSNIAGVPAQNIAAYDPSARSFSALGGANGGLDGQVSTLYCDASRHTLWVGGKFKAPTSSGRPADYGGAVARYTPANNTWSPPPFFGLTGASSQVYAITPSLSGSSLLFSGSFLTQFGGNATLPQNISNPNVPQSSGATPYSTSLVPVPLAQSEVIGAPSTSTSGFSDPKNILCPSGADGPGSSWQAQDGVRSVLTVRTFKFTTASGIRLGNTFLDGRGVKDFSVTTIPDNDVVSLTYIDPTTKNNVTCEDPCTLAHDPTVPYQDFLFSSPKVVTGFQLTVETWYGAGAGLHLLQLLSDGAFASAISNDNQASCYAPEASQVQAAGQWKTVNAYTDIAGTTQDVLVANVQVGTSAANSPTMTWHPYVSASGNYNVYLMVPGCQNLQDCANRTSVKVTVYPGGNLQPVVTTVSEQVDADTNQLIYSGPIFPATPDYTATVVLALADTPTGTGVNGQFDIVADRVQFSLVDTNVANSTAAGVNATGTGLPGYGFLEWSLTNTTAFNATGVLPNSTLTTLDGLASVLYTALGTGVATSTASVRAVVPYATDSVIFAGQFTLSTLGISNFAAYAGGGIVKTGGSGLSGVVNAMAATSDKKTIFVGGSFTDTADSNNNRYRGIVKYDYIAGNVAASNKYGAAGWAIIGNGPNGQPAITSTGTQLGSSPIVSSKTKRHPPAVAGWISRARTRVASQKRQASAATTKLPATPSSPAPAVLAGTYWTNTSTSNQVVVLGGNFSVPSTNSGGVALYDSGSKTLKALNGSSVNGVVRSLYITGNSLYVGGDFAVNGLNGRGLALYDLSAQQWVNQQNLALQPAPGSSVVIRSMSSSPSIPNNIVVAGSFLTAGSLQCEGICAWDSNAKQWHALGDGIHGEVAAVDYAGEKLDSLLVAGALTLADGTPANVAIYNLGNSTWKSLGPTPGPVTAVGVNNQNASNIWAAGRSADGSTPFLIHWNGQAWTQQQTSWTGSTTISELKFVPLQDQHSSNSLIESDRMLFICGSIDSSSQGVMSSALFDGQSFYPYLVTSNADGSPGMISALFSSLSSFSFSHRKFLAAGLVILISIAIATGIVLLLLLLGILWAVCARRDTTLANPNPEEDDDDASSFRHRPSSLLAHINAATRTTILGPSALTGAAFASRKGEPSHDTHADTEAWHRADTPSGEGFIAMDGEPGDINRPTHARYSFAGQSEGELPVMAGQELVVLDDRNHDWWYVRDPNSGREGVVPASYLY
ncbi:hypothetical protein FRB99_005695 [Tulasnella sp. 403]|nr:hypothetical protein FRB99_005695 [Tulasnella sp. 403]